MGSARHPRGRLKDLADSFESLLHLEEPAWSDFAKYLFAANALGASGIFVLRVLEAWPSSLLPLFCFCAGELSVVAAYCAFASWSREFIEGWAKDYKRLGRTEFGAGVLRERTAQRQHSWKAMIARYGILLGFLFLVVGGVLLAVR